jgi:xylose isomerase
MFVFWRIHLSHRRRRRRRARSLTPFPRSRSLVGPPPLTQTTPQPPPKNSDIAPAGATLAESNDRLRQVAEVALELQKGTNISVLWGTAQLFAERRYMHGGATAPNASVFAHAAGQVKNAIDATVLLGGENYLLWGGREGYSTLLNTDYAHEQQTLALFLRMVADYAKKAGLKGHLFLEPKPHEPAKHQCECFF